jgi:hypothetical protein
MMINALDDTLKALLKRELPKTLADQVQISFATPDDQFPPQSVIPPAIDLFLYDIRENRDLRSNEIYYQRQADGTATRFPPPVRVDFSYLITAWPSENVPDAAKDEHRLLGEVMRVLLRYRTLPEDLLQAELKSQRPLPPMSSLQAGYLESFGEFWQALGGKPKAALHFQVTIAVDAAAPEDLQLVTQKKIKMRMEQMSSNA